MDDCACLYLHVTLMVMYGSSICGLGKRMSDKWNTDPARDSHASWPPNCLQRNMADDEVLFDDVYELCEIIGK
jgi:hypothetical protein